MRTLEKDFVLRLVQCTELLKKGPRYLEMAEGYVTGIALDADDEIIGYQFVSLGKITDFIKKGDDAERLHGKKQKDSTAVLMTQRRSSTRVRSNRDLATY